VAKATARYGPNGTLWQSNPSLAAYAPTNFEIWNEPWLTSSSSPVDPARYARLFKASASAGRAANPQARFIVAAEWQYQATDGSWRNWVDDMYAAVPDLNSYADAYPAAEMPSRRGGWRSSTTASSHTEPATRRCG
jgi:hypothetical protein